MCNSIAFVASLVVEAPENVSSVEAKRQRAPTLRLNRLNRLPDKLHETRRRNRNMLPLNLSFVDRVAVLKRRLDGYRDPAVEPQGNGVGRIRYDLKYTSDEENTVEVFRGVRT